MFLLAPAGSCDDARQHGAGKAPVWSPSGEILGRLALKDVNGVTLYSFANGSTVRLRPIPVPPGERGTIRIAPSFDQLAVTKSDDVGSFVIRKVPTGEERVVRLPSERVVDLGWDADGSRVCAVTESGTIYWVAAHDGDAAPIRLTTLRCKPTPTSRGTAFVKDVVAVRCDKGTCLHGPGGTRTVAAAGTQVGGESFFFIRKNSLWQADLTMSSPVPICSPGRAYAFAHGFVVRNDGQFVIYDRPKTSPMQLSSNGFEWVLLRVRDGAECLLGDLGSLDDVIAWTKE